MRDIWASLLTNWPSAATADNVAGDKAKLVAKINDAKASLQKAEAALEPGKTGGRRRKTRKGKVGRKAKKGTRRH
jgi:hypothetical protein